jgi:hypothetical protein
MFEGTYSPPFYLDLYNFKDGAQDDIFLDSYTSIPTPSVSQQEVPTPINHTIPQPSSTNTKSQNPVKRMVRHPSVFSAKYRNSVGRME